jgi:hypothetical protein
MMTCALSAQIRNATWLDILLTDIDWIFVIYRRAIDSNDNAVIYVMYLKVIVYFAENCFQESRRLR